MDAARRRCQLVELGQRDERRCPPPTPLNSATICGIAVIFTRRAAAAPNATDRRAEHHQPRDVHRRLQQRRNDRDPHADRADLVAAPRGRRRRQEATPAKQTIVTR